MRDIVLLGASGSIGEQTLQVLKAYPKTFSLIGFSVGKRIEKIHRIIQDFPSVHYICVQEKQAQESLELQYPTIHFFSEDQGLISLIRETKPKMVVNALVGFVGFLPTYYALEMGIDVALSNKESLVVGGSLLNELQKKTKAKIYPIDSEHVALAKCLRGQKGVRKLILTASGGAFRSFNREALKDVKKEDALKHPSWNMGEKITIDCATMMNKGFECIEAHYLFHIPMEQIDILLHDESKIHSLVSFQDGSYLADIGPSDMRIPITYALFQGKRKDPKVAKSLLIEEFGTFHFHPFDAERFPCVSYARKAMKEGGTMPTVLNASNEVAVHAFLQDRIPFLMIEEVIEKCMLCHRVIEHPTVDDIVYVDRWAREEAQRWIEEVSQDGFSKRN